MNYWGSLNGVTTINTYNSVDGCMAHAVPTTTWWESYWSDSFDYVYGAAGVTFVTDTGYLQVTESNVSLSTGLIRDAIIYYNPMEGAHYNFTSLNDSCLVAHEVGHALGFGHHTDNPSIMQQGRKSYTGLQTVDVADFNAKY